MLLAYYHLFFLFVMYLLLTLNVKKHSFYFLQIAHFPFVRLYNRKNEDILDFNRTKTITVLLWMNNGWINTKT